MSIATGSRVMGLVGLVMMASIAAPHCARGESDQYNVIAFSMRAEYNVSVDYTRDGKPLAEKWSGPKSRTFVVKADSLDKVTYEKTNKVGWLQMKVTKNGTTVYDSGRFTNSVEATLSKHDMEKK